MESVITTITQKIAIDKISDVQVSDAVDDGAGGFVRSVKFFGEPNSSAGDTLVLDVRIHSETRSDLDITTPTLSF